MTENYQPFSAVRHDVLLSESLWKPSRRVYY